MYATTCASLVSQAAARARPRPFSFRCSTRTQGSSAARREAIAEGIVGAGVVGDSDPRRKRKLLGQVRVQPMHASSNIALFVVDRDDDVDHRPRFLGDDSPSPRGKRDHQSRAEVVRLGGDNSRAHDHTIPP